MVLAAIIWGWDTVKEGRMKCQKTNGEQLLESPTLATLFPQRQGLTKGSPVVTL